MPRLLFAARDLYPAAGGGARSMVGLLAGLAERGWEVHALSSHALLQQEQRFEDQGLRVRVVPDFVPVLESSLDEVRPDAFATQGWGAAAAIEAAKGRGLPVALRVSDLIQLTPQPFCEHFRIDHQRNLRAFARADAVAAISHFCRRRLEALGLAAQVVHPVIRPESCLAVERNPRFYTLASGLLIKGVGLLLEQAPRMPGPCLVCGDMQRGLEETVARAPNVSYAGYAADMRAVYAFTRGLLVLTQAEEAFGRVIVEAHLNGIPVVALDRGAVREVAGPGGTFFERPEDLPRAVRQAEAISPEVCRENARRFDPDEQIDRFARMLAAITPGAA